MRHPFRVLSLALFVGVAGVTAVHAQATPHASHNLDQMPTKELDAYLEAELDQIYVGHSKTEPVDLDELEAEIMAALSDAGHPGVDSPFSLADLEAEMTEDGTSLRAVVEHSLHAVDQASAAPRGGHLRFSYAGWRGPGNAFRTTRTLAVKETKAEIIQAIQAVKR